MSGVIAFTDATVATMADRAGYGLLYDGVVVVEGGEITAVGARDDVAIPDGAQRRSLGGRLVTPGLIDCHTHLIFGGNRVGEFASRLGGATYEQIAASGGGIRSTVAATRAAGEEDLYASAFRRLQRLHTGGVTTVEVKSGYGLDVGTELTMLRIARRLNADAGASVRSTFLGAHAVPAEWEGNSEGYVDLVVHEMLPAVAAEGLADAVDVFCEHIAFSPEQTDHIFTAAAKHGLPVKIHGAQLSANRGIAVAAAHNALSADHLEHASDADVAAMALAGIVAVLLPGAAHVLQVAERPPIAALRRHGVPIALATDLNPGTSPVADLALVCNLGALLYGLTPEEAILGVTRNAAMALGLADRGVLAAGLRADIAVWDAEHPAELLYWMGMDLCAEVWVAGEMTSSRGSES